MEYNRSNKYGTKLVREKIMGPNPIKLEEELLMDHQIPQGAMVMDLGNTRRVIVNQWKPAAVNI